MPRDVGRYRGAIPSLAPLVRARPLVRCVVRAHSRCGRSHGKTPVPSRSLLLLTIVMVEEPQGYDVLAQKHQPQVVGTLRKVRPLV